MDRNREITVHVAGREYGCELVPDRRNRHICLRVHPLPGTAAQEAACWNWEDESADGQLPLFQAPSPALCRVRVSYPPRLPRREVMAALEQQSEWIHAQHQKLAGRLTARFGTGSRIWYRGRRLPLVVLPARGRRGGIEIRDECVLCCVQRHSQAEIRRQLQAWYCREAERLVRERIAELARPMTARPFKILIGDQQTRWGSCSANGRLHFNWRVAMVPDGVRDYLMVHELAHLEELNHSERYWDLVKRHYPAVKQARLWLRKNTLQLELN
ncbi:MAG: SprT family zinc-dependent metalloprotease [candidate division FCPU426 bacterium]